jgi:amidase
MLPIADGSDMGGSLRNPASFCNVVGLRPSPGRVPVWPSPLAWSTLSVEGPMARTVADVAFFLSAIAGPDRRSPIGLSEPGEMFAAPLGRDFKGVRIAWWKDLSGLPVEAQVRQAINAQRVVFESLGCIVEDAEPDFSDADEVFKVLRAWAFSARLADLARKHPGLLKATILQELERANRLTARDIAEAEVKRGKIYHRVRQFMQRYEFFVLPVSQVLPFDVQQEYVAEIAGVAMASYIDWMKSCYYLSTVGNPALSVPCEFSAQGLPVGIQIVGRHNADWEVLQMGFAFEQARNLPRRVPPVASK